MRARLNYIRIAPRKLRLVADLVRGKRLEEAKSILKFSKKKGAVPLAKLLNSAEANAKNISEGLSELSVSKLTVDEGPVFKRYMARARGATSLIRKKTSKVYLELSDKGIANNRTNRINSEREERVKKESSSEKVSSSN